MGGYRYATGGPVLPLLFAAVFVVFGAFALVTAVTNASGPGLVFMAVWLGAVAWNAYWWLWRISYRIEVDGDRLLWAAPLRRGEARVSDVVAIRPWALSRQIAVLELRDAQDVVCLNRKGFAEFAAALDADHPIPVTVTVSAIDRVTGFGQRSGFERED